MNKQILLDVIKNKLYGIFNFFLFNILEDYYRKVFFSTPVETINAGVYSKATINNFLKPTGK